MSSRNTKTEYWGTVNDKPKPWEPFLLEPDELKIEEKPSNQHPNTSVFIVKKEDHTLGNLISQRLLNYNYITFAAYQVEHPLFAEFSLRVSTDGSISPRHAVIKCCKDVAGALDTLRNSFHAEHSKQKIVNEGTRARTAMHDM